MKIKYEWVNYFVIKGTGRGWTDGKRYKTENEALVSKAILEYANWAEYQGPVVVPMKVFSKKLLKNMRRR